MGMVMYLRAADPEVLDALVGDADRLVPVVCADEAWEADKLWWAALALALGPRDAVGTLSGQPITADGGCTPVMRITSADVARLAGLVSGIGPQDVANRFDAGALGEPLGPPVQLADREWLCSSALDLIDVVLRAWVDGDDLVWVVL